jgi:hypothetical protein
VLICRRHAPTRAVRLSRGRSAFSGGTGLRCSRANDAKIRRRADDRDCVALVTRVRSCLGRGRSAPPISVARRARRCFCGCPCFAGHRPGRRLSRTACRSLFDRGGETTTECGTAAARTSALGRKSVIAPLGPSITAAVLASADHDRQIWRRPNANYGEAVGIHKCTEDRPRRIGQSRSAAARNVPVRSV